MAIMHEQIHFPAGSSIILRRKHAAHFTFPYHYHGVYELVYVIEGYGTRYMGDNIEAFSSGDMVLVGPNLPHCWESDKKFYTNDPNLIVRAIILQLPGNFFDNHFTKYPEFNGIMSIIHHAERGLRIENTARDMVAKRLEDMFQLNNFQRIIELLSVLNYISEQKHYRILAGTSFNTVNNQNSSGKLNKVIDYIYKNYNKSIRLEEIAGIADLSTSGFCVWFKKNTSKRFSDYLNEIRVAHCCSMLKDKSDIFTIAQIGYDSGFENLSNFNRIFKRVTGLTPSEYKNRFRNPGVML
jgi:AraC-like DNA-binding protein